MTNSEQIQNQALGYMQQVQAATLEFVNTLSESWTSVLGQAGGVGANIDAPPAEIIDRTFDFSARMLEAQRALARSLIEASAPAVRATEQVADVTGELGVKRAARHRPAEPVAQLGARR